MQICTVATRHTWAACRVLVRDVARVQPGTHVTVLDVDSGYPAVGLETVLSRTNVGLGDHAVNRAALLLEPSEFASWLQVHLVRTVLSSAECVLSLPAGARLLEPIDELADAALEHGLAVIPRCPIACTPDGFWPSDADLHDDGPLNPRIWAVTRRALPFLDSSAHALEFGAAGPAWLSIAAATVEHTVVSDQGLGLSVWSLGAAATSADGSGRPLAGGSRVRCLDLSEFDRERPWLIGAVHTQKPRALLSEHPAIRAVCRAYAADLDREANAVPGPREDPVAMTNAGVPVHDQLRRAYRDAIAAWRAGNGDEPPDPFDLAQGAAFAAWLDDDVAPAGGLPISRYLMSAYHARLDLQSTFPGVPDRNAAAFLDWADRHGRHEDAYPQSLIASAVERAFGGPSRNLERRPRRARATRRVVDGVSALARRLRPRPHGVNVVGYLGSELGIGESARLMLEALDAAGIPHSTTDQRRNVVSRQQASSRPTTATNTVYDTTLLCINADLVADAVTAIPWPVHSTYRVGMWYWETEEFPEAYHSAFEQVDEIWAATDFVRDAIAAHTTLPVVTVMPPLPQRRAPSLSRGDLGLPGGPLFLFSFDYLSTAERKNPLGLVEAFRRAFARGEGPTLVIKSINADQRTDAAEQLRARVGNEPDVVLMESYLDAPERDALVAACDCYVSLHRSEGLGLTMAEAMAYGKPVIATAYGGNLGFMTNANSFLVPWQSAVIPAGCEPYLAGGLWAEPDLEAAARAMCAVLDDPSAAAERGRRAAEEIATLHSPREAGRAITERLAEIRRRGARWA